MFCKHFLKFKSCPEKAAIKAGYSAKTAKEKASSLLEKEEIKLCLKNLKTKNLKDTIFKDIVLTLKKLINYKSNDAAILATHFEKMSKEEIKMLNLFQICEIKKLKDGGFEFKFVDKIKAIETLIILLEKLEKTQNSSEINNFLKALTVNEENKSQSLN